MIRTYERPLTEDERGLLMHIVRWGSDGYPIRKSGKRWTWDFLSVRSPVLYATKREAVTTFERFLDVLSECRSWEREQEAR